MPTLQLTTVAYTETAVTLSQCLQWDPFTHSISTCHFRAS